VEGAGPLYYEEGFTGTGEVLGVHRLTGMLSALKTEVVVRRGRVVTADDLRRHNVVILGSPFQNETLVELQRPLQFVFERSTPLRAWKAGIVDRRSNPQAFFGVERDPRTQVILADHAVFAVLPGMVPGRRIVIMAGVTTSGTQGAVEFATSPDAMQELVGALGQTREGRKVLPEYFECVLRVQVARGLEAMKIHYVRGRALRER